MLVRFVMHKEMKLILVLSSEAVVTRLLHQNITQKQPQVFGSDYNTNTRQHSHSV